MTTVIPIQTFGLGDIIFSMTAIKTSWPSHKILWPVEPDYVEGLNNAYPDVQFVDRKLMNLDYQCREFKHLTNYNFCQVPLRFSDSICGVPYRDCMKSKYMLLNQDWKTWKKYAMWKRNTSRETDLFKLLGLNLAEKYTVVNEIFQNNCKGKVSIHRPDLSEKVIYMKPTEGFSLFDWAMVLEHADRIHTVSTSILYILEMLELKAQDISIYIRRPNENSHANYSYILQAHKYNLID